MNKYYVTCGRNKRIVLAHTDLQACIVMLQQCFGVNGGVIESIGTIFRVSEKGFGCHRDDQIYETSLIVNLQMLSNEYEEFNEH